LKDAHLETGCQIVHVLIREAAQEGGRAVSTGASDALKKLRALRRRLLRRCLFVLNERSSCRAPKPPMTHRPARDTFVPKLGIERRNVHVGCSARNRAGGSSSPRRPENTGEPPGHLQPSLLN